MTASSSPDIRDTNLRNLHPVLREKVAKLQARLAAEGIPLKLFEGYRTPFRQKMLFDKHDGSTMAAAWQSNHNYGMAVDFVFFEPEKVKGGWHWSGTGRYRTWWDRYHAIGRELGLRPLSFEAPHLELVDSSWKALRAGRYPTGGDEDWADNLTAQIRAWGKHRGTQPPPVPRIAAPERPPIAAQPNVTTAAEARAAEAAFVAERAVAEPAPAAPLVAAAEAAPVAVTRVTAGSGSWVRSTLTWMASMFGAASQYTQQAFGLTPEIQRLLIYALAVGGVVYLALKFFAERQVRAIAADPAKANVK